MWFLLFLHCPQAKESFLGRTVESAGGDSSPVDKIAALFNHQINVAGGGRDFDRHDFGSKDRLIQRPTWRQGHK